jgi:NADH:ubiquinone oxidoreductase subunit E
MPIQLTLCRLCSRSRPAFLAALRQLAADYPDDLIVVELECMAACDDVPAVMIETDYFPQVTPDELMDRIRARVGAAV